MGQKPFKLPEAVYRQALWAARDLPRMKEKLAELEEATDLLAAADPTRPVRGRDCADISDITGQRAVELAQLTLRIRAIEDGFLAAPPKYRSGLREHLSLGAAYPEDFHRNTWKKWQQIVLYTMARNLKIF